MVGSPQTGGGVFKSPRIPQADSVSAARTSHGRIEEVGFRRISISYDFPELLRRRARLVEPYTALKLRSNGLFTGNLARMCFVGLMKLIAPLILSVLLLPSAAQASEKLRGEEFCFPAKDVPKIEAELAKVDADRRDVVDVKLDPKFLIKDGGDWPEAFYLKREGTRFLEMPLDMSDEARVPDFLPAVRANPDADICVLDPTRAARPEGDEGLYFEMGLSPMFHNRSGVHDLAELREGAKDGKKFYKKMIPSAFRMFMPDTDHLAVKYKNMDAAPQLFARTENGDIALLAESHKDMHVVSLKDLKQSDASALVVRGGAYDLQPVPSPKTMRRFGWGQDDDEK